MRRYDCIVLMTNDNCLLRVLEQPMSGSRRVVL
jgi:hypothetical protein